MGSISDKISYLEQTKQEIANAIVEKGQTVQDSDTFRSYANKIKEINSGGSSVSSWDSITDKPFETLGDGLNVNENGVLSVVGGIVGSNVTVDVLWNEVISSTGTYTLAKSIDDYDFLIAATWTWTSGNDNEQYTSIVIPKNDYYVRSNHAGEEDWSIVIGIGTDRRCVFQFDDDTTLRITRQNTSKFKSLYGIKVGSGGSGSSGSNVSWNQIQKSGNKIAEVTIDGTITEVFTPSGSGGSSDSGVAIIPKILSDIITKRLVASYSSSNTITCEEGHSYLIFLSNMTELSYIPNHNVYVSGADIISDIVSNTTAIDNNIHLSDTVSFIIRANQAEVLTRLEYPQGYDSRFQYVISFDITGYEDIVDINKLSVISANSTIALEKDKYYMVFIGTIGGYGELTISPQTPVWYNSNLATTNSAYNHSMAAKLLFIKAIGGDTTFTLNPTIEKNCLYVLELPSATVPDKEPSSENKESIELTQAEYDALPDTKLSDNKNYFIRDANPGGGSGSSGGGGNIYSTEEQVIGTWIDGRPVYRRVISNQLFDIGFTNITSEGIYDQIIHQTGYFKNGNEKYSLPRLISGSLIEISISSTNDIRIENQYNATYPITFIIEYTKTTD